MLFNYFFFQFHRIGMCLETFSEISFAFGLAISFEKFYGIFFMSNFCANLFWNFNNNSCGSFANCFRNFIVIPLLILYDFILFIFIVSKICYGNLFIKPVGICFEDFFSEISLRIPLAIWTIISSVISVRITSMFSISGAENYFGSLFGKFHNNSLQIFYVNFIKSFFGKKQNWNFILQFLRYIKKFSIGLAQRINKRIDISKRISEQI